MPDCGNPYLSWHHFDPPWEVEAHHRPDGMIALCGEHHPKADGGAFTKEQLRAFKENARERAGELKGRFDWMRREILCVAGSNFGYQTRVMVRYKNNPVIWLNRDEDGYQLVNVMMPSTTTEPRAWIEDNFWVVKGTPEDLECPPSGRLLHLRYANGDMVRVEFFEVQSVEDVVKRYPKAEAERWGIPYPVTAVEIYLRMGGTEFEISPRHTRGPGNLVVRNCFVRGADTFIAMG